MAVRPSFVPGDNSLADLANAWVKRNPAPVCQGFTPGADASWCTCSWSKSMHTRKVREAIATELAYIAGTGAV